MSIKEYEESSLKKDYFNLSFNYNDFNYNYIIPVQDRFIDIFSEKNKTNWLYLLDDTLKELNIGMNIIKNEGSFFDYLNFQIFMVPDYNENENYLLNTDKTKQIAEFQIFINEQELNNLNT